MTLAFSQNFSTKWPQKTSHILSYLSGSQIKPATSYNIANSQKEISMAKSEWEQHSHSEWQAEVCIHFTPTCQLCYKPSWQLKAWQLQVKHYWDWKKVYRVWPERFMQDMLTYQLIFHKIYIKQPNKSVRNVFCFALPLYVYQVAFYLLLSNYNAKKQK